MKNKDFRLKQGQQNYANDPIISFIGKGGGFYIWVGNNIGGDKRCYATLSGKATLKKIADEIYKRLGLK